MDSRRYLELILADSNALLRAVQRDPDAAVSTCPGWTATDLVGHVGQVYEHKTLCMTLGHQPRANQRISPPKQSPALSTWFIEQRDTLLEQLTERGPTQATSTWFPPDQSVGFWYRRMALETAVHRVDAELATGTRTPVDPELAIDGIDELVGFLVHDFGDSPPITEGAGRTIRLQSGQHRWTLTLRTDGVDRAADDSDVDGGMKAAPQDLLLHLWNRDRDNLTVQTWGDPTALVTLATRFAAETQ